MYKYIKLNTNEISEDIFKKIYAVELSSNYESYNEDSMRQLIFDVKLDTFVCLYNDKFIGIATFNPNTKKYPNSIYMINITVKPEYQGKQIAKNLMLCAYNHYKDNPKTIISNEVDNDNLIASNLYKKIGFKKVDSLSDDESSFLIIDKHDFGNNLQQMI